MLPDLRRVEEIFLGALEHSPETRMAFVRASCGDDASVLQEVTSMLHAHAEAAEFLEQPAVNSHAGLLAGTEGELQAGEVLGACRILSLLGEGGMGEVYLAEDTELERKVAIKVIKRGLGTRDLIRHLRREARILAGLSDPNIAQLYGVAVTPLGLPYFIMEYIEGERLDDNCARRNLTTTERLELFRKVCSAVSYAHQHLIIHRDLKPANIRVTAAGEPKLLDFGIAKLLDPETTQSGEQTMTLAGAMTPDYASPEQVRGESMTTASDVYSLGVVLYELLTGERPYSLTSRRPTQIARAISEQTPVRPSLLRRELAGDLDNILLMALRKEPARRYVSVAQFSEDIRRHLDGLPVTARMDTLGYRASKFVWRHKTGVAAAAFVTLALVVGLLATTWQARVARQERDHARFAQRNAELAKKQADRLDQFLEDLLSSADPAKLGKDVKVVQVLDAVGKSIDADLGKEPEVLAQVHETLSRAYQSLKVIPPAVQHARAALGILRQLHGDEDLATAKGEFLLGSVLAGVYQLKEAEPLLSHALAVERRQVPPDPLALATTLRVLGETLARDRRPDEAASLLAEALVLMRAARGERSLDYVQVLYTQAYAKHMETEVAAMQNKKADLDGAIAGYRRVIGLSDQLFPNSTQAILARMNLCICLARELKFAEAERELDRLDEDCRKTLGEDNLYYVTSAAVHSVLDFAQGNYSKVLKEVRKPLDFFPANEPADNRNVVQLRGLYGVTLTRTGHAAEGEPFLRTAYEDGRNTERFPFELTFGNVESALGECLLAQGRYAEAEPLLLTGYEELKTRLGEKHRQSVTAAQRLRELYTAWNKPAEAARHGSAH